jgi:hypothetical protein
MTHLDPETLEAITRIANEIVDTKIRDHERRVGWVSGLIGVALCIPFGCLKLHVTRFPSSNVQGALHWLGHKGIGSLHNKSLNQNGKNKETN